jgi:hypothetical protein
VVEFGFHSCLLDESENVVVQIVVGGLIYGQQAHPFSGPQERQCEEHGMVHLFSRRPSDRDSVTEPFRGRPPVRRHYQDKVVAE